MQSLAWHCSICFVSQPLGPQKDLGKIFPKIYLTDEETGSEKLSDLPEVTKFIISEQRSGCRWTGCQRCGDARLSFQHFGDQSGLHREFQAQSGGDGREKGRREEKRKKKR
jgi:hypothetical protein